MSAIPSVAEPTADEQVSRLQAMSLQDKSAATMSDVPVACSGSCLAAAASASSTGAAAGDAADIEDLHFITIRNLRRPRPPIVPFLCPFRVHLEPGKTYRYCTCGRSEEQPWCDDSHLSSDPQPIEFKTDVDQSWTLICGCKYSTSQPFCDGSHTDVEDGREEILAARSVCAAAAAKTAAANATASTSASTSCASSIASASNQ